jgi:glycosyltransferase involved in cell wall biosynthesis
MQQKEKIRVLRIINRFNIGGPTYNAVFLSRYLSDDFETLLVGGLPEEGESDSLHIAAEYNVKPLLIDEMKREPSFSSDRQAYKRIQKIIEEFQPHIVHTHAAKAGALGRRAAKKMKVPVIVHTFHGHVFHSYFGRLKTTIFKQIERSLARNSTGIIAISALQKQELSNIHRICSPEKISVINLGFDLEKFYKNRDLKRIKTRQDFSISEDEIAVAIVGRLAPVKNHSMFLDVVEGVARRSEKKVRFFIVGDGTERAVIEKRIDNMQLSPNIRVEMTSWIKDISAFNPGMDIICLTSLNEGTPVSLIEAQASGVAIVSTDVGGVRDIILEGETGFVTPLNDVELFTEKLVELVEDEKKRVKMSQNGWNFVEAKFSYKTLVANMEKYYRELLKKAQK